MAHTCTDDETNHQHLTIRYTDDDDGIRPISGCVGFWRSPDLWIDHGSDTTTSILGGSTAPGAVNRVKARVTNMTPDTTYRDINVEAWICRFGTGAAGPHTQVPSAGGLPRTGFHPGPLAPGQSVVITCDPPWQPDETDGGVCLVANCWADDPTDGRPLTSDFDFCCDAHHARRVAMSHTFEVGFPEPTHGGAGGFGGVFQTLSNPDPQQAQEFLMQIVPVDPSAFGPGDAEFLRSVLDEEVEFQPSLPGDTINYGIGDGEQGGHEFTFRLEPGQERQMFVSAGHSDIHQPVGRVYTFDIIQRTPDGEVLGGVVMYLTIIHGPVEEGVAEPEVRDSFVAAPSDREGGP